jgi:hypothetical protein
MPRDSSFATTGELRCLTCTELIPPPTPPASSSSTSIRQSGPDRSSIDQPELLPFAKRGGRIATWKNRWGFIFGFHLAYYAGDVKGGFSLSRREEDADAVGASTREPHVRSCVVFLGAEATPVPVECDQSTDRLSFLRAVAEAVRTAGAEVTLATDDAVRLAKDDGVLVDIQVDTTASLTRAQVLRVTERPVAAAAAAQRDGGSPTSPLRLRIRWLPTTPEDSDGQAERAVPPPFPIVRRTTQADGAGTSGSAAAQRLVPKGVVHLAGARIVESRASPLDFSVAAAERTLQCRVETPEARDEWVRRLRAAAAVRPGRHCAVCRETVSIGDVRHALSKVGQVRSGQGGKGTEAGADGGAADTFHLFLGAGHLEVRSHGTPASEPALVLYHLRPTLVSVAIRGTHGFTLQARRVAAAGQPLTSVTFITPEAVEWVRAISDELSGQPRSLARSATVAETTQKALVESGSRLLDSRSLARRRARPAATVGSNLTHQSSFGGVDGAGGGGGGGRVVRAGSSPGTVGSSVSPPTQRRSRDSAVARAPLAIDGGVGTKLYVPAGGSDVTTLHVPVWPTPMPSPIPYPGAFVPGARASLEQLAPTLLPLARSGQLRCVVTEEAAPHSDGLLPSGAASLLEAGCALVFGARNTGAVLPGQYLHAIHVAPTTQPLVARVYVTGT